jgi:hypothetical protein
MPLVYLDTNALNNVVWRASADTRQRVHDALRSRHTAQILVLGTLLEELAPMLLDPRAQDPDDYAHRMLTFLLSGVKVRALFQPSERIQREVDAATDSETRPLWNCLHSEQDTRALLRHLRTNEDVLKETVRLADAYKPANEKERAKRFEVHANAPAGFDLADVNLEKPYRARREEALEDGQVRASDKRGAVAAQHRCSDAQILLEHPLDVPHPELEAPPRGGRDREGK